jgi:hypothetical protein
MSLPKQQRAARDKTGHDSSIAQAISRHLVTPEVWVKTQDNPDGICGGQSHTGIGFSLSLSEYFMSIVNYHSVFHIHVHLL